MQSKFNLASSDNPGRYYNFRFQAPDKSREVLGRVGDVVRGHGRHKMVMEGQRGLAERSGRLETTACGVAGARREGFSALDLGVSSGQVGSSAGNSFLAIQSCWRTRCSTLEGKAACF